MVTRSDRGHFTAELFHFGKKPRSMGAEFYLLNPGEYEMILLGQGGKERVRQKISVKGRRTRAEFELPPQQLVELRIEAFK
jgi:hypothetical protein